MSKMANSVADPGVRGATQEVETKDEGFKPLTREEAQRLREANPSVSPWAVLAGQLVVGILVALAAWGLTGRQSAGWSALYGALAVVIPGAVFARGLTSKVSSMNPGAAVAGFFLWEMVKIALTIAMLIAAPRLIEDLSWPAMLVGLIVTMKVYWGVLWFKPKRPTTHQT